MNQTDFLDHIVDNEDLKRREIWRDGRMLYACSKFHLDSPVMQRASAEPWGAFSNKCEVA